FPIAGVKQRMGRGRALGVPAAMLCKRTGGTRLAARASRFTSEDAKHTAMKLKGIWGLFTEAIKSWSADYAPSMGAALSYYTLFSIAPLLIIVIAVAGFFFGADEVRGTLFAQLSGLMGDSGAKGIQSMLQGA